MVPFLPSRAAGGLDSMPPDQSFGFVLVLASNA